MKHVNQANYLKPINSERSDHRTIEFRTNIESEITPEFLIQQAFNSPSKPDFQYNVEVDLTCRNRSYQNKVVIK